MFGWESKLHGAFERGARSELFLVALFTVMGLAVRVPGLGYISGDMSIYLLPWYEQMASQGFGALAQQIGDYGIPYQTLMILATYLPFSPVVSLKLISIASDVLFAFSLGLLVVQLTDNRAHFTVAYAIALLSPVAVVNSSVWGQCDALFTALALLAVYYLLRDQPARAFVFLGLSFAFKLQAVFILPLFIFHYIVRARFSIAWFGVSALTFMAASFPGYLMGRSLLDPFAIYLSQTGTYPQLNVSYPSIWAFLGEVTCMMKPAIVIAFAVLFAGLVLLMRQSDRLVEKGDCVLVASWVSFTCVELLPSMHERYAYLAVALLIVVCFVDRRVIPIAGTMAVVDLLIYGRSLVGVTVDNVLIATVVLTCWMALTYLTFCGRRPREAASALDPAAR